MLYESCFQIIREMIHRTSYFKEKINDNYRIKENFFGSCHSFEKSVLNFGSQHEQRIKHHSSEFVISIVTVFLAAFLVDCILS